MAAPSDKTYLYRDPSTISTPLPSSSLNHRRSSAPPGPRDEAAEEEDCQAVPGRSDGDEGGGITAESRSARALLKELGHEFVHLREQNRTSAWAAYQRRIANNLHILIPFAISLKEATSLLREIEEFMKNDQGASVATPSEQIRAWLNAGVEGRAS